MLRLLVRHPSSCAQTVFLASFRFCQIVSLVTLLRDILARMGKETLDTLPGNCTAAIKALRYPLSSVDALSKYLELLDVQDRRIRRLCVLIRAVSFTKYYSRKIECLSDLGSVFT